jgi:hypothetical protein
VSEGRTIEYKRELPGNSDSDKKEFLADVSSLANTAGGDLVLGVEEAEGVPTQITGFQSGNPDADLQRLDSILNSGLDPRIRYATKLILCGGDRRVLIVRIEHSWNAPHRVIFKGHDRFYARNSTGKYPLDVDQLRAAFNFSQTVSERIRAFRADRIIALSNNDTPIPFVNDPKIVLHCIPIESFAGQAQFDVLPFNQNPVLLRPMGSSSYDRRLNLEGVVAFGGGPPLSHTYTQLYRNGVIEAVQGSILAHEYQGKMVIPSIAYERYVFKYLPHCFEVVERIGANVPVAVALTLIGTRGLQMGVQSFGLDGGYTIKENILSLPESIVYDFSLPTGQILKPIFDLVWNACGYTGSANFDAGGTWIAQQ